MDPIVRQARASDLPALMALFAELDRHQRAWRVFPPRSSLTRDMSSWYRRALEDPACTVVVAEVGGEVVGMATGHPVAVSSLSDEVGLELASVVVLPGHRGRGVGRALSAAVIAFARDHGLPWVTLRTFAQNEGALSFWRRLGFRPRIVQLVAAVEDLQG